MIARFHRSERPDIVIRDMEAAPIITPEVAITLQLLDDLTGAERSDLLIRPFNGEEPR